MDDGEFAILLRERRREVERALAARGVQLDGIRSARGSADSDDEHDPEGPTLSSEWSRVAGLHAAALAELDEIVRAEERVRDGSYGACQGCGRSIPPDRLRIRPETRWCVPCAAGAGR